MLFHLPEISFPLPFPGALYVSPVLFSPSLLTFYCHNLVIRPLIPRNGQIPQNSDCFLQFCSVFYRTLFEVLFLNILLFNFTVFFFLFHRYLEYACVVIAQSPSCIQLFAMPWTAAARPPCLSPSPGVCLRSYPLHWWCHHSSHPLKRCMYIFRYSYACNFSLYSFIPP